MPFSELGVGPADWITALAVVNLLAFAAFGLD
jgi:hypothetical protein